MFMDDTSCMVNADRMSCGAMREMAQKEYLKFREFQEYMIHDESCKQFHTPIRRDIESSLQYTAGSFKDACLDPSILSWQKPGDFYTLHQDGPWIQQHTLLQAPLSVRFDEWTKAKHQNGSHPMTVDTRVPSKTLSIPNPVIAANDARLQPSSVATSDMWGAPYHR